MPRKKTERMVRSSYESSMATFMLTLERPSAEQLTNYDRGQKYVILKRSASKIRERLVEWIDENGLSQDIVRVGEPTVFNTLFVTSTWYAAEKLTKAPGVVDVAPSGEVSVDLLAQQKAEPPEAKEDTSPSLPE